MIWFSSDQHFGHQNILNFARRPFSDMKNQTKLLVMNWNEVVGHDDTVFVLGDFALGKINETLPIAHHLNGTKILVAGNHDRCFSGHGPKHKLWIPKYIEAGFVGVIEKADLYFGDYDLKLTLSHFPFSDDKYGNGRFDRQRPVDDGQWLLHGHTHSKERINGRQIHVGVDARSYYPVSLETILDEIDVEGRKLNQIM